MTPINPRVSGPVRSPAERKMTNASLASRIPPPADRDTGNGSVSGGHVAHFPRSRATIECPNGQRGWASLCSLRDVRPSVGGNPSGHERGEAQTGKDGGKRAWSIVWRALRWPIPTKPPTHNMCCVFPYSMMVPLICCLPRNATFIFPTKSRFSRS